MRSYIHYREDNSFCLEWGEDEYRFVYHPKTKVWTHNAPKLTFKMKERIKEHQFLYENAFSELQTILKTPKEELKIDSIEKREYSKRIILTIDDNPMPKLILFIDHKKNIKRVVLDETYRVWEFEKNYILNEFKEIEEVKNWLFNKSKERVKLIFLNDYMIK